MLKESLPKTSRDDIEIIDVKTLSSRSKMRYLLNIFDIGKDKNKIEARKNKFLGLIRNYHQLMIKSRPARIETESNITYTDINTRKRKNQIEKDSGFSDESKKRIHDQIMEIIRNMSLSKELSVSQRKLTEFLTMNRDEVEKMISEYFSGYKQNEAGDNSMLKMALRGEGPFEFSGKKED